MKFFVGMENKGCYTVWRTRDVACSEMNLVSGQCKETSTLKKQVINYAKQALREI